MSKYYSLLSFDKSVAFHLTPVLPTFYDECKGLSAKMFTAALAPQNTIWVQPCLTVEQKRQQKKQKLRPKPKRTKKSNLCLVQPQYFLTWVGGKVLLIL